MNLESYLSDLNEFNITSQLSENNVLKSVDGDNVLKVVSEDNVLEADDNKAIEDDLGNDSLNEGNFESFVDGMMNDFLNALKEGKSEEEAMDISGVNSITLMSWKIMAESGDETFKKFPSQALLCGQSGMGKTSLLHYLRNTYSQKKLLVIDIERNMGKLVFL